MKFIAITEGIQKEIDSPFYIEIENENRSRSVQENILIIRFYYSSSLDSDNSSVKFFEDS